MSIEKVHLVILDVDGVLTDGGIYLDPEGRESKRFSVIDGTGIKYLQRSGLFVAIISGRRSDAVSFRATELGIEDVYQGCLEKITPYERLKADHGLSDEQVCYIGDDLPDIPLMRRAGYAVAVADAREEVRAAADYVATAEGGRGAVREAAEMILKAQGKWENILKRYICDVDPASPEQPIT